MEVGTRVRVESLSHALTDPGEGPLLGTVVDVDDEGYLEISLDRAVIYHGVDRDTLVQGIVEADDNLEAVANDNPRNAHDQERGDV